MSSSFCLVEKTGTVISVSLTLSFKTDSELTFSEINQKSLFCYLHLSLKYESFYKFYIY